MLVAVRKSSGLAWRLGGSGGRNVASTSEGFAPFGDYRTWYRVTGDLAASRASSTPPLVVLHGGPGCTHHYVLSLTDLATAGRAVIHYDQLGCGQSSHLPDRGADFFTVELFLAELDNLLVHLDIAGRYDVLGQSWGGMLAAEHAVRRPPGLSRLVIANSPASMALWRAEAGRLRSALPAEVQAVLDRHEAAGTVHDPAYLQATAAFYAKHVCRLQPMPPEVSRTFALMEEDPTVYHVMNGPNEFHVVGSLKDWDIRDRLDRIAVPTLVINGAYDEATDACVQPYVERIAGARWRRFADSSHMPHVEERQAYMAEVDRFLHGTPA
jgi:L-proline amide hydrolase